MEYSKEDLMEAKKQIWGVGENMGTEESKKIWEENAQFWDNAMGDESNEFHREVVRPKVTELLSPNPADYILDIACGNGNYSSYLAQRGASVVAFDYSKKMIELAKRRQSQYEDNVNGKISDERFMELSADYEQEQRELKDRAAALQAELDKSQAATVNAEKFMGIVRKHLAFEELTPTLLREMIEKIVVHECSYDENGTRRQDIEIYYSFVGKIDLPE